METLKIGYDGKRAVCNNTGLGNYSRFVIDAMSLLFPKNRYIIYTPTVRENPRLQPLLERKNVELAAPQSSLWRHFGGVWRALELTRTLMADDVNLYHGLSNQLPLNIARSGIPSVVTMHDVIWRRVPGDYAAADRRLHDFKARNAIKSATRIIAISECTKRDLISDFGADPAKIDVIYQGCDPQFSARLDLDVRRKIAADYKLPERFIVSVGTVQSRKNQLLAVKALRALPADVKLVIIGGRHKAYGAEIDRYVAAHGLADRVMWLQNVPFAHLPYIYALARCSAYPSRYEGFGIPVIESLSVGTPVIAARGSCLEEAGGKGAIYVDPDDVDEMADAAMRLLDDNYLRSKMADAGARHIKKFSIAEFARQTMATYNKAIVETLIK